MAQQVTKGRRMGLKDVYVALVTSDTTAEYVTDTPVLLARALSAKLQKRKPQIHYIVMIL